MPPQEQPPRPRSHTVTTTSSSFTANLSASSSTLAYDREFLRTVPGLLMVTEIVSAPGARRGGGASAGAGVRRGWGVPQRICPCGSLSAGEARGRTSPRKQERLCGGGTIVPPGNWKRSAGHTRSAQPPVVSAVSSRPVAERRVLADREPSFGDFSVTALVVYALHLIAHE